MTITTIHMIYDAHDQKKFEGARYRWECDNIRAQKDGSIVSCAAHARSPYYDTSEHAEFALRDHKKRSCKLRCNINHTIPVWFINKKVGTYIHLEDYVRATHCPTCGVRLPEVELPEASE